MTARVTWMRRRWVLALVLRCAGGFEALVAPPPRAARPQGLAKVAETWAKASALAVVLATSSTAVHAENELSALGANGFDASLIDTECITGKCAVPAKACLDSDDCRKGMTCTAKCLGDNACITGCFAKYGNDAMTGFLDCTVEQNSCVKIAILPAGPFEAPPPPVAPLEKFDPSSLQGDWYKVLGWNSRYDCFDCQKNAFDARSPKHLAVDVEFAMPRPGKNRADSYPLKLSESMDFDYVFENGKLVRHARSVGHLFGLTFWENWSVIGQNAPGDDEWKFVYYTGKTTQNTYEGAFVYSRTPELPASAKRQVESIARQAGIDPKSFCLVRNDPKTCDVPSAAAEPQEQLNRIQRGLFVGAATAAEDANFEDPPLPAAAAATSRASSRSWLDRAIDDLSEYLEDPKQTATWLFNQQVKVPSDFFLTEEGTTP